jgi:hypothetical protein
MESPKIDRLSIGMGLGLFILALIYCFADVSSVFDKSDYTGLYKSAIKYAFVFLFDFINIVFKIMLVLLFIYVFIVVYNITIVGIFKPLLSDNVDSNDSISGFNSARQIIEEAQKSYFSSVKVIAKNTMKVVFGFMDIPNTIVLFFIIIPLYLLFVVFAYYRFIVNKRNINKNKQNEQKFLTTNYHYLMILIFTIVISFLVYILWKTFKVMKNAS